MLDLHIYVTETYYFKKYYLFFFKNGWLNGVYVPFQLIYGDIETDDDNDDDKTETWLSSQGQGFFYMIHIIRMGWDALYDIQGDTAGLFLHTNS